MLKCLSYKFQYPKLHYFPLVKSLNCSQSHIVKDNMCSNQKLNEYAKKKIISVAFIRYRTFTSPAVQRANPSFTSMM